jgi:hypothetical protein
MRKKQSDMKTTLCPFLEENCLKLKCEIYNTVLDRCEIGLLGYNLYQLTNVMKQQLEIEMNKRV